MPGSFGLLSPGAASPESRLQAAVIRVVGAKGYRETTVADVAEEAGVSRDTFEDHFTDKAACFLATQDALIEWLYGEVAQRCDGRESWPDRMRDGLAAIVETLAADSALARTVVVEAAAAGADARRRHWKAIARFAELLEPGRDLAGDRQLPGNVGLMSAGAVSGLIFDEVLAGRADRLPAMLPDLLFAMLAPYIGPNAAADEMRRAAAAAN